MFFLLSPMFLLLPLIVLNIIPLVQLHNDKVYIISNKQYPLGSVKFSDKHTLCVYTVTLQIWLINKGISFGLG